MSLTQDIELPPAVMTAPAGQPARGPFPAERMAVAVPQPASGKLEAFEAVRGLAALLVVAHHLVLGFFPRLHADANQPPWIRVFYQGEFGVRLFFVLSGFVLSLSFLKSRRLEALRSAAVRRYWRLLIPVAASIFLSYLLLSAGLYANQQAGAAMGQNESNWLCKWFRFEPSFAAAGHEAAWGAFFSYSFDKTYNNVLWTMQAEFAGSLFIFAFLALTGGARNRWVFYTAAAIALYGLDCFWMLDFLAGAVLCELYLWKSTGSSAAAPCWLCIAAGLMLAGLTPQWLAEQTSWVIPEAKTMLLGKGLGAVLVLTGVLLSPPIQRSLSWPPLLTLGVMSFPLYLVHVLVQCSLGCGVYLACRCDLHLDHGTAFAWAAAATVLASLFLAWVGALTVEPLSIRSGRWIENVFFRSRDLSPARPNR